MADDQFVPRITELPAPAFGWGRVPHLDTENVEFWEMPDGQYYAAEKRRGVPLLIRAEFPPVKR